MYNESNQRELEDFYNKGLLDKFVHGSLRESLATEGRSLKDLAPEDFIKYFAKRIQLQEKHDYETLTFYAKCLNAYGAASNRSEFISTGWSEQIKNTLPDDYPINPRSSVKKGNTVKKPPAPKIGSMSEDEWRAWEFLTINKLLDPLTALNHVSSRAPRRTSSPKNTEVPKMEDHIPTGEERQSFIDQIKNGDN